MTPPIAPATAGTPTRPYLIRALHDWCTDNGFTPYVAVYVDKHVQVPNEYVKNNEIVLNVGFEATSALKLGNEAIEFKARFGGTSREIIVPVDHVIAIYARENGQGMAFPMPADAAGHPTAQTVQSGADPAAVVAPGKGTSLALSGPVASVPSAAGGPSSTEPTPPVPPPRRKPALKRVK
ncbi:MAG: ClpXP protease specificity-enhancing factor [Pseudomonadota bacterium]|nr:ClpXP protease specificity-enhancing factor [Pseudomonadota bacterium]